MHAKIGRYQKGANLLKTDDYGPPIKSAKLDVGVFLAWSLVYRKVRARGKDYSSAAST